jgi:hypothetical protein
MLRNLLKAMKATLKSQRGAIGVYFDGRRLIRPQAATKIDDSGMYARGLAGGNILALIGECTGGEPQAVQWFTDPSYAKAILRSGELLTAVQRAYDPSSEVNGAYMVAAVRVNPALQSSLILRDSSGNPLVLLTSVDYGAWNNQIRVRMETGTNYGKKLTLTYGTAYDQGDDIYKKSFYLGLTEELAREGNVDVAIGATKLLTINIVANAQQVAFDNNGVISDVTSAAEEEDSSYFTTAMVVGEDYIYVGSDLKFNLLRFAIGSGVPNAVSSVLSGEFFDGEWTALPNFVDGTLDAGRTMYAAGDVSFFGTAGNAYTYPTDWIKTTYNGLNAYWVRLKASASLTPEATMDSVFLVRKHQINLVEYPTIQLLVDYLDALPGLDAGTLTASPTVDLSTELDDLVSGNMIGGGDTNLATTYTSGRSLAVDDITNFAIGDNITISTPTGSSEESRRITGIAAGVLTIDSDLSTTYISGSAVREALILRADLQGVIDWINAGNTAYLTAEYHDDAVNRASILNIPDTYMTGGSEGTTAQSDWDACLDLLKTEDTQLISCVSYDPAVWASLSTHCAFMSTVGKKERIGFCGGFATADGYTDGLGKWAGSVQSLATIDAMLDYAMDLNSDRMVYVGPGFLAYDENGTQVTYAGHIAAALVAGMAAGVDVATALTHKTIKILGLEYNFRWADLDRLLLGGVCPLEYNPGQGYRVCQSITTWLANDKYNRREVSVRRTADYIARQVRDRLENDFVGQKGTLTTLISIKNATESVLVQMYRMELLAGDATNPPYKNIQVRLEGDICWVDFECSPVIPINYLPITIHLTTFMTTLVA